MDVANSVGRPGLEPGLTDPKSAVLPIKLSPKNKTCLAASPERVRGFEPLTCCLGSNRSTSELYPQLMPIIGVRVPSVKTCSSVLLRHGLSDLSLPTTP